MTNPYIYPGARVRYRGLRALEYEVAEIANNGYLLLERVGGWHPPAMFKPVVRVKMGRAE